MVLCHHRPYQPPFHIPLCEGPDLQHAAGAPSFGCLPSSVFWGPNFTCRRAKDLISSLLLVDPSKRFSAGQALRHPWTMQGVLPSTADAAPAPLLAGTQTNLKKHFPPRKFKAIVGSVIALNRCVQ